MAQHPTVTTTRTVTPASVPPPPLVDTIPTGPAALLAQQRMRDLLASVRDIPSLNPLAGIVSGPGNQGSANQAHLAGHAGTAASAIAVPRQLKIGQSGSKADGR